MKQMTSLDEKHQEMLNKFHNNEYKTVPKLKNENNLSKKKLDENNAAYIDGFFSYLSSL